MNAPNDSANQQAQILKATREAKGLSLETVHDLTKIPLDVLKAIEEGYTVRLAPYYFSGFVKMYAKYLGLDPKDFGGKDSKGKPIVSPPGDPKLANSPAETANVKFKDFLTRQRKKDANLLGVILGVIVFILLVMFIMNLGRNSQKITVRKEKVQQSKVVKKEKNKKSHNSEKTKETSVVATPAPVVVAGPASAPVEDKPVVVAQKNESSKKVSLTVKSKATGWLQVKVDGILVFQSTMREGTSETWQGDNLIELSGKNINNLEFEVNGKILGQLSRTDRGARRVIVTSEGLSVKK